MRSETISVDAADHATTVVEAARVRPTTKYAFQNTRGDASMAIGVEHAERLHEVSVRVARLRGECGHCVELVVGGLSVAQAP
jgi:hypothetical protein